MHDPDARPAIARLAIIIPAGPGEQAWRGLLPRLAPLAETAEIVVSACGPRPSGPAEPGFRWLTGPPGRAGQLNRGVAACSAPVLWLLHADSRPGPVALEAAAHFAGDPPVNPPETIGWFDLAFDDGPRLARLNARGANLRSALFGLPFGDQGWLVARRVFDELGGFDPGFGRGEDLDFVVRARRQGVGLTRIGVPLATSARRYREHGWLRTTLAHLWLTLELWNKSRARTGKPES
ncbi:MAG: glycosyltransferase [Wenzhouxiangellaceae bacterium]|nr:glycosyltransferase [Wenzhouxiangellaceae bacterium]